nr:apolipoprotein N-acyltransferase [Galbitalea soli]
MPLWASLLLAAVSGVALDDGFPDLGWWPMTFVGIGMVLVAMRGRRPRSALLVGFVAGVCFYLIHIEWASLFLGPLPMTALAVLESLFVALGTMCIALAYQWVPRAWPGRAGRLVLLPIVVAGIWTAREGIASVWPYGGFAWGRVALSQSQSPLAHLFAWVGVSGVSFLMVLVVALTLELAVSGQSSARTPGIAAPMLPGEGGAPTRGAARLTRVAVPLLALTLLVVVPAFPLVLSGSTTVAAVQGDGPAGYFQPHNEGDLLAAQYAATIPLYGRRVDMVIWPEGASDLDPLESRAGAAVFDEVSRRMNAPLIAGTITHRGSKFYNTSLLWEAGKGAVDFYDKKHPVPFGEYVPDRAFWRPFAPSLIDLIGRDYTPGTTDTVFDVNGVIAGIDICFDISDDNVMRESVLSGAQFLIAQTNNADFGHTDESVQQLAIARIRAMELGRSLVNDSTVGTSAIIAPDGSTIRQLTPFTAATMVARVPLSTTVTPAAVAGSGIELFVGILGLGGLLAAIVAGKRNAPPAPAGEGTGRRRGRTSR